MPIALSLRTSNLLTKCVTEEQRAMVEDLLVSDVSENVPWHHDDSPEGMERIRFAIIKLTLCNELNLPMAVDQAKRDWRDLLVMAGFADDINEHLDWCDRILHGP